VDTKWKLTLENAGITGTITGETINSLMSVLTEKGINYLQLAGQEKQMKGTQELKI
jgi:hypothetical protein